jgi:Flp pilus assembly protein TadG
MYCPAFTRSPRQQLAPRPARSRAKRRSGVAVVEFALISPFLFFMIVGMAEMGRAIMIKDILSNAARTGCSTGILSTMDYTNIISDVNTVLGNSLTSAQVADATITVQTAPYTGSPGGTSGTTTPSWGSWVSCTSNATYSPGALDKVSVKVSIPVANVLWFSATFLSIGNIESEMVIMVRQG